MIDVESLSGLLALRSSLSAGMDIPFGYYEPRICPTVSSTQYFCDAEILTVSLSSDDVSLIE